MNALRYVLCLLFSTAALLAQNTAVPLLVDVDYLSRHLNDPRLVVVEVGSRKSYESQHIPNARLVSVEDVSTAMKAQPGELALELLPPDVLRSKLASFGISDDSHIVVYSGKDAPFQLTTRVIFALQYVGLGNHTSLLNGGLGAWTAAGLPVTSQVVAIVPGKLTARPAANVVADAALVRSIAEHPDYKLVDARTPNFYKGLDPSFTKSGHIPDAINIPFNDVLDSDSTIDIGHITKLFTGAGIRPGDTVVTYCHLGAQATATLFAARVLGHPVMLYDGSFQDWATNNRGDVVK